ncbi:unnamed protein product [Clonostachys rosea f. rosea IK726]|uniref:Uncharacterized protein n=1 Tax=Clonostachys rosea f. rosea IK726 TaxID=1349383 RepID=A0ACA9UF25_BIOOC|nr:unnamed protein product [Clonostachys rosea f. rosea IK726]
MELGGNAPFIVFDEANCEQAIQRLMAAKFRGSGQTCVAQPRLCPKGIHDAFIQKLQQDMDTQPVKGDTLLTGTTIGPLSNVRAVEKVERLVSDARPQGATVVRGGTRSFGDPENYYPPTIVQGMTHSMQASKEELFGPVVAIYPFESQPELLRMANDADVGLGAYVYTDTLNQARRTAELLQTTAMAGVNTGVISDPVAPFGGVKHSGFEREGGRIGIDEFQILKASRHLSTLRPAAVLLTFVFTGQSLLVGSSRKLGSGVRLHTSSSTVVSLMGTDMGGLRG